MTRLSVGARRGLVAAALAAAGWFVFSPALNRYFADDQLWYFAELKNDRSFAAGLKLLDYNATRTFMKGDQLLYRPLLFLLLAAENTLFGRDYRLYNALNLLLHLGTAYLLYELLYLMEPSEFAALFALLFCVLTAGMEVVVWNHLGGYILNCALLLLAMLAALKARSAAPGRARAWLAVYAAAIAGAMLSHEIAVAAAFLLGALLIAGHPDSGETRAAAAAPVGLYAALYALHAARCERLFWTAAPLQPVERSVTADVARTLALWGARSLDPRWSEFALRLVSRFHYAPRDSAAAFTLPLAAAAAGAAAFFLRRGLTRARARRAAPLAGAAALLILGYAVMTNLGRTYAQDVTYYLYFFSLMAAILLYSFVDFSKPGRNSRAAAAAVILGFIALNARATRQVSVRLGDMNAPFDAYADGLTAKIDAFIRDHRDAPLTFAVKVTPPNLNPLFPYWVGFPEGRPQGFMPLPEILYTGYRDSSPPKYVLNFDYARPPANDPP